MQQRTTDLTLPRRVALVATLALTLAACATPSEDADGELLDGEVGSAADEAADDEDDEPPTDDGDDGDDDAHAADDGSEDGGTADPVLAVVATVPPVADLVSQVGGDRVEAVSLVPPGADAHTYEPRPQDVVTLSDADAYLGVGFDLNAGAVRMAEENLPEDAPLVLLGELALEDGDLVFDHGHGDDHGHGHDDGDDHGHGHDDGDDHGHGHGDSEDEVGPNPHVWTSLRNTAELIEGIAATLAELDPDGAGGYGANADAYLDELEGLDASISEAVATIPEADRTLVTYHDAWTYFARDHDLEYAVAVQPTDLSEPSAAEVRAMIDELRELDVPVVFGSEEFPTPVLETIAEETGVEYVDDLADDVLPREPGDPEHTYLELMRRNAVTIVEGLGGDAEGLERR